VIDDLLDTKMHGLSRGDTVPFEARHIIDIQAPDAPRQERRDRNDIVTVSVEMLHGFLPILGTAARCALNDHTDIRFVWVEQKVIVGVYLRADDVATTQLRAAAKSLGFVPDYIEASWPLENYPHICVFVVTLPYYVKGPELLAKVRKAIDLVQATADATPECGVELAARQVLASALGSDVDTAADAQHTFRSHDEPDITEFILSYMPDSDFNRRALEARKQFMERLQQLCDRLFTRLGELGVIQIGVEFHGSCDEGQVDSIRTFSAADRDAPSLDETDVDGKPLREVIEEIVYGKVSASNPGWEIDTGSSGTFTFDVASRQIRSKVTARVDTDDDDENWGGDDQETDGDEKA
jgi:hypothetical protein